MSEIPEDVPVAAEPKSEVERLREEVAFLKTCGIVELAVRNSSVADYMRHWEQRAELAEVAIEAAILAERERAAEICEQQAEVFLSPEYATGQPLSSFKERFACERCASSIRQSHPPYRQGTEMSTANKVFLKRRRVCDFCGKGEEQVKVLIVSPGEAADICDECVGVCVEVIVENQKKKTETPAQEPTNDH